MHELTEAAAILEQVALVITLPSGTMEHYDQGAEQLFRQLGHDRGTSGEDLYASTRT